MRTWNLARLTCEEHGSKGLERPGSREGAKAQSFVNWGSGMGSLTLAMRDVH
jgi:hypothetical protein